MDDKPIKKSLNKGKRPLYRATSLSLHSYETKLIVKESVAARFITTVKCEIFKILGHVTGGMR